MKTMKRLLVQGMFCLFAGWIASDLEAANTDREESILPEDHPLNLALDRLESDEAIDSAEEGQLVKEIESWFSYLRRKIKETEGAKGHGTRYKEAQHVYWTIRRIGVLVDKRDLDLNTRPLVRLLEDIVSGRIDIVDYKGGMVGQAVSLQGLFKDRSDFSYFIRILETHPNYHARLDALGVLGDLGVASDADLVKQAVREMEPIPLSKEVPPGEGVTLEEWHEMELEMHEGLIRQALLGVVPALREKGGSNE